VPDGKGKPRRGINHLGTPPELNLRQSGVIVKMNVRP
jgi:hypothetical protein